MVVKASLSSFFALLLAALAAHGQVHEVKGVVVALRPETQVAVIRHEAIPGLMPAMTMPFAVPAEDDFSKLSRNDSVRFEFVMEADGSHARAFEVLGKASPEAAARRDMRRPRPAEKLEEGSAVPPFQLEDQDGEPTDLRDDEGRFTLMTFIFTRCPVPDFCPLMSSNFSELQSRFDRADLLENVRLLSVTIDPEYDTPSVLREYGKALGADFAHWAFATAGTAEIDKVASAFRLYREENGAVLDHTLATALIAPDGTMLAIWRGNRWTTDEVFERTSEAVEQAG